MIISMKLVYQYMAIFINFLPTSGHLHPLQVENCDSNSRLVVDEDDNRKFRLERVKGNKLNERCIPFIVSTQLCYSYNFCFYPVSYTYNQFK